jgi:NTP pyrophosphatase (non-canonical NTP hydrolase)
VDTREYDKFVQEMWFNGHQPVKEQLAIAALGIAGEAGETAELIKKYLRGDGKIDRLKLIKELGDVQFYITKMASLYGFTSNDLMQFNIDKLTSRRARGTQRGNGDDR